MKTEREEYTDFLGSLELFAIALVESTCSVDHERMFLRPDPVEITFQSRCDIAEIGEDYFEIRAFLKVTGAFAKQKRKVLNIEGAYNLHVHSKPPLSRELVQRFATSEARLLAWPYFREFVTSTCGRMQIPPIVLPLSSRPVKPKRVKGVGTPHAQ